MLGFIIFLIVIILIIMLIVSCIKIVPQANAYVVERLGKYFTTWNAGLHIKMPFIDQVVRRISLKEQVADFEPQPVITKDNVTMMIDSIVFFYVQDPKLMTYGVERPIAAIENLSATTLRNIIGTMTLDETLTSRDLINGQITTILDEATDKWGIKVTRVEVKNIIPPRDVQDQMERQMRAERERREKILQAEGEKRAAILEAEGQKEAMILKATAKKESMITEAEGQAVAMERVFKAQALGIQMINEANPSKPYLTIEGYKALEKLADGQSTKIIVPSNLQDIAGTLSALGEVMKKDNK